MNPLKPYWSILCKSVFFLGKRSWFYISFTEASVILKNVRDHWLGVQPAWDTWGHTHSSESPRASPKRCWELEPVPAQNLASRERSSGHVDGRMRNRFSRLTGEVMWLCGGRGPLYRPCSTWDCEPSVLDGSCNTSRRLWQPLQQGFWVCVCVCVCVWYVNAWMDLPGSREADVGTSCWGRRCSLWSRNFTEGRSPVILM